MRLPACRQRWPCSSWALGCSNQGVQRSALSSSIAGSFFRVYYSDALSEALIRNHHGANKTWLHMRLPACRQRWPCSSWALGSNHGVQHSALSSSIAGSFFRVYYSDALSEALVSSNTASSAQQCRRSFFFLADHALGYIHSTYGRCSDHFNTTNVTTTIHSVRWDTRRAIKRAAALKADMLNSINETLLQAHLGRAIFNVLP